MSASDPQRKSDLSDASDTDQTRVPEHPDEPSLAETRAVSDPGGKTPPAQSSGSEDGKTRKVKQLGDFKIEKKLGSGGMGEVYLAHQISLDRRVALKTLSKELAKKEDFVKRFQREARAMAKLDHPHAVKVYAVDSVAGIHFAAIEYIDGQSMQDWMKQLGKLSVGDALHIILAAADALRAAYEQSLIHRDIKPDNLLVTSNGVVKVADFGLAKALDDEDVSMTQSGTGLGTPLYMAPEQARNAKYVDHRSDIYALGTTLYYFVTGDVPFRADNTLELIMAKEKGIFTSAKKLNPEVTERLALMIDKMIARDPQHRYADYTQLINDLEGLGLASPSLTFIDHPHKAVRGAGVTTPSQVSVPAPVKSVPAARPSKSASATQPRVTSTPGGEKIWLVQYPDSKGRLKKARLSTDRIKQAIRSGMIDTRAKTQVKDDGPFIPLAQVPEFDSLMQGLVTKQKADARSRDMASIYEQIDRQEKFRKRFGFLSDWFSGLKGGIGLLIYLAVIAAIIFAGWKYGWPYVSGLINGEAQQSAPAENESTNATP